MADTGIDSGSFDFYEGIRIFIPGAMGLAAVEGVTRTVRADGHGLGLGAAPAVVAALVIGMCLYYVDAPAKATIMVPDRPTSIMESWGFKTKDKSSILNNYFVLLDVQIPPAIRARALYMGSMFRIGMEAIYIFALVSALALSLNAWTDQSAHLSIDNVPSDAWVGASAIVAVVAFAFWRDKFHPSFDITTVARNTFDQVLIVLMVVAFAALVIGDRKYGLHIPAWASAFPAAGVMGLWSTRYFRGYVDKPAVEVQRKEEKDAGDSKRKRVPRIPISAANASLLLASAHLMVLATLSIEPLPKSRLNETELRGWLGLMLLSMILVCSRGHEKRLRGGYATQNTWLARNKDLVVAEYFIVPTDQDAPLIQDATSTRERTFRLSRLPVWLRLLVRLFGRD